MNKIPLLVMSAIEENYAKRNIEITQIEQSQFKELLKPNISHTLETLKFSEFIQDDNKRDLIEVQRQLYDIPCLKFSIRRNGFDKNGIDNVERSTLYSYRGQWNSKGQKHGIGIIIESDSSVYNGSFENDKKQGKGILVKLNGDYYKGEFSNDEVHGTGTLNIFSEYQYNGKWMHNSKNGFGIEVYNDGSRYEGEFANNLKQGKGLYSFSNGSYYEGEFLNSQFHGQGKFVWKDGRKYFGLFAHGKIEGSGQFTWPNGCEYQGEYKNSVKQGKGVLAFSKTVKIEGHWLLNKLHGKVEVHNNCVFDAWYRYGKMISSNQKKIKTKLTNGFHSSRINQKKEGTDTLSQREKSYSQRIFLDP